MTRFFRLFACLLGLFTLASSTAYATKYGYASGYVYHQDHHRHPGHWKKHGYPQPRYARCKPYKSVRVHHGYAKEYTSIRCSYSPTPSGYPWTY
ncbi:hypothetical protein HNR42_000830 [Deinobacterium chartae]|uniref:Uncharacterized protein n=1 Tax=Deinobacterium chartae TaxID=521158 RepID=A0A841HX34_9DEIO|nr:hypothetical protein [Deinobacterium chartae]MBB6097413.1 hypothetical protein [Deinobacterium chartae]